MAKRGRAQGWILLVEDDHDSRYLFESILALEGYHVVSCSDCDSALHIVADSPSGPRVVIADWHFPDHKANVLFEGVRTKFPRARCVILTADTQLIAPADAYTTLFKPFDVEELTQLLRSM